MASLNKVQLIGNAGRDTEVRYLPSGQAVANVSIATTTRRKDKETGDVTEDTQWHRITFYDRLAEIAGEYVVKGKTIYVEGRLKYGKYTDKDGVEKNTVDIIATEMQLLGGRNDGDGEQQQSPRQRQQEGAAPRQQQRQGYDNQPRRQPEQRRQQPQQRGGGGGSTGFDDMDSDIPF